MRPPTNNPITQHEHGAYHAVDYSPYPDPTIYAPEDGVISAYYPNAGTAGNNLQLKAGNRTHGFCHLERPLVSVGDHVSKGQPIGIMGWTGYVEPAGPAGRHLHAVLQVDGNYTYPIPHYSESFNAPSRSPSEYMHYEPTNYTVVKRVVKAPTTWWNLSNDSADIGQFQAAATLPQYAPFTVGGYAVNSHFPQYRYALTPEDYASVINGDYTKNNGVNVLDLEDMPPAAPQIINTPNIEVPRAEKYLVVTRLMHFTTPSDALHHQNVAGDIEAGEYYVIMKQDNAYNLSDDNMKDRGWWVNISDNVIQPEPVKTETTDIIHPEVEPVDPPVPTAEQPKIITQSLRPDGAVVLYEAINAFPVQIRDFSRPEADIITMQPYNYNPETGKNQRVPLVATFTQDGKDYGVTQKVKKAGWLYAIPMSVLRPYEPTPQPIVSSFDINKDGDVNLKDFTEGIQDFIVTPSKRVYAKFQAVATPETVKQVTQRASKFIDGFSKRSK